MLESRTVKRLGESEHRPIDVRLVAATHRDLRRMVNAGAFREDLYFRLAVLPLVLPPLRARKGDIPLLFRHFLGGRQPVEPVSERELAEMPWLGNVRELRNFVERACAIGAQGRDGVEPRGRPRPRASPAGAARRRSRSSSRSRSFASAGSITASASTCSRLLERHGRNVPAAAEEAGPRSHLRLPPDPQARPVSGAPAPVFADALACRSCPSGQGRPQAMHSWSVQIGCSQPLS